MKKLTIYLVDDHILFREGLKFLLSNWEVVQKVYEAGNGRQFIEGMKQHSADVVLMDIEMPVMNGLKATRIAHTIYPEIKIVALSMYSDIDYCVSMVESGANGFLLKNSCFSVVQKAIEEVRDGKNYFSQEILQLLVRRLKTDLHEADRAKTTVTGREEEILNYICQGLSDSEIANFLKISKRTVDKHRQNLLRKTHTKNVVALVLYAVRNGYYNIH